MNEIDRLREHVRARVTPLTVHGAAGPHQNFTGTFVEWGGRHFILTAAHCLREFQLRRDAGHDITVQAVFAFANDTGQNIDIESYGGYFIRNPSDYPTAEGDIENEYEFKDLAVLEISNERLSDAKVHRSFVTAAEFASVDVNQWVILTGYPSHLQSGDGNLKALFTHSFTFRTVVASVSDKLVQLLYDDESDVRLSPEPKGISGSGVYDDARRFVGIVWGGSSVKKRLFACPASLIAQFLTSVVSH